MNFWSLLSALACVGLVIRLAFFTDTHRRDSRWIYRAILFGVTVYSGNHVIDFLYTRNLWVNPFLALLHLSVFVGAFVIRPEYLPWNQPHETANDCYRLARDLGARLLERLRSAGLRR